MRVKGYGAYPTRNILPGGHKYSYDEYNREYKKVRYTSAEEYACRNVKEYQHYDAYNDMTDDDDRKQQQVSATGAAIMYGAAGRNAAALAKRKRIMQQVVCLIAGSTIIVSTYQAMMNQKPTESAPLPAVVQTDEQSTEQEEKVTEETTVPEETTTQPAETTTQPVPAGATYTPRWSWSGTTAALVIYGANGNLISRVPASVSVSIKEATCTASGQKTYTASAYYDGNNYSDTRTETINPLGHSLDDGKEIELKNGKTAMQFECERCHEKFVISNEMAEND